MSATLTQLHISVRIDSINPVHVRMTLFTGMAYSDAKDLASLTRGKAGDLTVSVNEAAGIVGRLQPVVVHTGDDSVLTEGLKSNVVRKLVERLIREAI